MNDNCPVHGIYPFQHSPSDDPFANLCLCSGAFETVVQTDNKEDPVSAQSQASFSGPSSPIQSPVTSPVTTTTRGPWQCALCPELFPRKQERNRHELAHFPFNFHCPAPKCTWRGNRPKEFQNHWQQEDHRRHHGQFGRSPVRSQIQTYNMKEILDRVKNGVISLLDGQNEAIFQVQIQGYELQKFGMLTNPWGLNRRYEIK